MIRWGLSIITMLLILLGEPGLFFSQTKPTLFERLDQINAQFTNSTPETEVIRAAPKIWSILDEALVAYLDDNRERRGKDIKKSVEDLFEGTMVSDEHFWSDLIELYDVGRRDQVLAIYANFYSFSHLLSTFRVLQLVNHHWTIVGRMEDSILVKELAPEHRQEAGKSAKKESKYPTLQQAIASAPIEFNGLQVSSRSIERLQPDGLRFVTFHTPRYVVSEPTLIEWEWVPANGLAVKSWVWGDEWVYDQKTKTSMATWHPFETNKKARTVKMTDYPRE